MTTKAATKTATTTTKPAQTVIEIDGKLWTVGRNGFMKQVRKPAAAASN